MSKVPVSICVLVCLIFGSLISVSAQEEELVLPNHTIFFEGSMWAFAGAAANGSLNYELMSHPHWCWRIGYGVGAAGLDEGGTGHGWLAMPIYLINDGSSKWEAGAGMSYVQTENQDWKLYPSFSFGYRHQPLDNGFFYRVGLTWVYLTGGPLQISVGYTL